MTHVNRRRDLRCGRLGCLVVGIVAVGLCGCATRDQFLRVRKELVQVRRVLADTQSDVQAQRRQIQALLGESDTLPSRPGVTGGAEGASDIASRVAVLEAIVAGQAGTEAATPAAEAQAAGSAAGSVLGQELARLSGTVPGEDEYRLALALVDKESYGDAIPRLRSYLRKHPDTPLSDNAQYWIGECYYAQRDFNNAILAFYDVTRRYPKGDKVCAAMLKQGFAFAELGDVADARIVLERLVQTHPDCEETARARDKLSALRQG